MAQSIDREINNGCDIFYSYSYLDAPSMNVP
jgi:hypothetical protein